MYWLNIAYHSSTYPRREPAKRGREGGGRQNIVDPSMLTVTILCYFDFDANK